MFTEYFILAYESNHPFLFDDWFFLLEYVLMQDISDGARRLVLSTIEYIHINTPFYGSVGGIPTRDFVFTHLNRQDIRSGSLAGGFWTTPYQDRAPSERWGEYIHWYRVASIGGTHFSALNHWHSSLSIPINNVQILIFPFWRWLNIDTPGFYPICPIWFITLMGHNLIHADNPTLRDVLIVKLVSHIAEIRDRGFYMYRDIVAMLTDVNSVFDSYTYSTFEVVQRELFRHGLAKSSPY